MPDLLLQIASVQAPAPARASTPTAADIARLDAQLEYAAKQQALAGMKRAAAQAGGADANPAAPAPPAPPAPGTITYTKDGIPVVLSDPTTEMLAQLGIGSTQQPALAGWQLVALTGTVVWGAVAIVAVFLWHRRKTRGVTVTNTPEADARMVRIENAIESIAVEVERISEGQRYAARLLTEGAAPMMSDAVRARESERVQGAGNA
jgi:hypothetical protein